MKVMVILMWKNLIRTRTQLTRRRKQERYLVIARVQTVGW